MNPIEVEGSGYNSIREKEKNVRRHISLMVVVAFTVVALAGLGWAQGPGTGKVYEGMVNIAGTVEKAQSGYALKTSEGKFRLTGADASTLVGKKVKAWGTLTQDEGTLVMTINVDKFEPAKK